MSEKHLPGTFAQWFLRGLLLLVPAYLLLSIGASIVLEIPFHFLFGWIFHGWRLLPPFFGKWQEALLPLGCLFLAVVLANRFMIRWAEKKRHSLIWRMRHTVAIFSLLFLCSAAAIATSGVVHQLVWLGKGKIVESNMSRARDWMGAMSQCRELSMTLMEFYQDENRYPVSFAELKEHGISERLWMVKIGDSGVWEPFILLRPGSTDIALDEDPLIVSPLLSDGTRAVVGYGDMSVRMVAGKGFSEIVKKRGGTSDE